LTFLPDLIICVVSADFLFQESKHNSACNDDTWWRTCEGLHFTDMSFLQTLNGTFGFSEGWLCFFKGLGAFSSEFFSSILLSVSLNFFLVSLCLLLLGNS
jgi:hypothetical protein